MKFKMLGLLSFFFTLFMSGICQSSKAQINENNLKGRYDQTINSKWRFIRKDISNGSFAGLNDQTWQIINIPHTWNNKDAFNDMRGYYRGPAWYRKHISISSKDSNKQIFLKFGAANQKSKVYVNGHYVMEHKGGYTAFAANITKWVHFGETNIIAVRVDNSFNPNIPPLDADYTFFGGIYRNVNLIVTNPIHIAVTDYASPGVHLHTRHFSEKSATINAVVSVVNNSEKSQKVDIENIVMNRDGKTVTRFSQHVVLAANGTQKVNSKSDVLKNPHLWSPDNPYLYAVKTVIRRGNKIVDEEINHVGIRWYRFDPDKGFFLNGHHLALRGVNRHQFYPGKGNALSAQLNIKDMKMIKDMGANFVRLAHYPQDPSVLQAADRLGILIWQETPNVDYIHDSKSYTQTTSTMLREMINQYYNHPSIILWGYMNEIFLREYEGRQFNHMDAHTYDDKVVELAKKLNKVVHETDPTRLTVMAMNLGSIYDKTGLSNVPDVDGWNLYHGWYNPMYDSSGTNLFGKYLDDQHKKYPKRILMVSEYGAGSDDRIHTYKPQRFDFSVEYQDHDHEVLLNQLQKRKFVAGSILWVMYDFPSEGRNDTRPWINEKGLVNRTRKPKEVYFFYKARLSHNPVVHIASHDWTHRTVPYSKHQQKTFARKITAYSNLSGVQLSLNGKSLGVKKPGDEKVVSWSVPLQVGENQLVATGKSKGKKYSDEVTLHVSYRDDFTSNHQNYPQLLVNAGSHYQYYPKPGVVWEQDQAEKAHKWGYTGGKVGHTSDNILNTTNDPVYQYYRVGMKQYHFDVPQGQYAVTIYLAEPKYAIDGKRIFSVKANSKTIFDQVDLGGTYGKDVPVKRKVILDVDNGNGITISFEEKKGKAIVNGIGIRRF
jgi:beta-galactosidase